MLSGATTMLFGLLVGQPLVVAVVLSIAFVVYYGWRDHRPPSPLCEKRH